MTIGWIGLGHMGSPMAQRLLNRGHDVIVYNRTKSKADHFTNQGATVVDNPADLVQKSDIIFMMVSDEKAIQSILYGEHGIFSTDIQDKTFINLSTISPTETIDIANKMIEKGATYLESPVSGSVGAAVNGQLVLLLGGDAQVIDASVDYLNILGKELIHFGDLGTGSAAKLTINLLLGIMGSALAETILLGESFGLPQDKVLSMISASGMNSPLYQGKKEMYRSEEFPSAFPLYLMEKDLGLIRDEMLSRFGSVSPLAEEVHKQYAQAKQSGYADMDLAAIYKYLKNK